MEIGFQLCNSWKNIGRLTGQKSANLGQKWWFRHFFACRRHGGDDSAYDLHKRGTKMSDSEEKSTFRRQKCAIFTVSTIITRDFRAIAAPEGAGRWGRLKGGGTLSLTLGIILKIVLLCNSWRNRWKLFAGPYPIHVPYCARRASSREG